MATLARISLLLVILLVTLSAYLRLGNSGIGCEPWPACYGNIGEAAESPTAVSAYERLLQDANEPRSWATPLHRLVASLLGLMILGMSLLSLQRRKDRIAAFNLLALTVFLAWLGIYSEGLHNPAIVMGNLTGGFAMLGLLGWMVVRKPRDQLSMPTPLGKATLAALAILGVQILLGGLTSANFAASACQTLPDCQGSWLPGTEIYAAFDLSRAHETGPTGMVLGGPERAAIHKLHRIIAVLASAIVLLAGIIAFRKGGSFRIVGSTIIALVTIEFSLGIAAIIASLPIEIAVAHNWIAAILLLAILKLLADSRAVAE